MENSLILKNIQVSASLEDAVRIGVVIFKNLSISGQHHHPAGPHPGGKNTASPASSAHAGAAGGAGVAAVQALAKAIEGTAEELRRSIGDRLPSSLPAVERTRRLYRQLGMDPTRRRPSSEKLLRQVLRSRPFPRQNTFVDAMKLVSLRLQFPLGLYDWDRLVPPVLLRIGSPDEKYPAPGGDIVSLEGNLVLVDGEGPFGNPTIDSERAMIHPGTVRALVVIFGPRDVPRRELEEAIAEIIAAGGDYCGGKPWISGILP